MRIVNGKIEIETKGDGDLRDITSRAGSSAATKLKTGIVTVFVAGSTAAVTTAFEYEPGMVQDITELYARLVPRNRRYAHDETWGTRTVSAICARRCKGPRLSCRSRRRTDVGEMAADCAGGVRQSAAQAS